MRRALFLPITLALLTLFSAYAFAQDNQTAPPDACAGISCNNPPAAECDGNNVKTYSSSGTCNAGVCSYPSSTTSCRFGCSLGKCKSCEPSACGTNSRKCADGYVAQCQQTCGGADAACVACEPSCAGHETAPSPAPQPVSCAPSPSTPTCSGNTYPKPRYEGACLVAYDCTQMERCPAAQAPQCEAGTKLFSRIDSSGCLAYSCERLEQCRDTDGFNIYAKGAAYEPDSAGPKEDYCLDGKTLKEFKCEGGKAVDQSVTCENGCKDGYCVRSANNCGNYKCDEGETGDTCPQDCIPQRSCPVNRQCEDGSTVSCRQTDYGCQCDQCKERIPPGCRQEHDEKGFLRVTCERQCAAIPKEAFDKCSSAGGRGGTRKDPVGCDFLECRFDEEGHNPIFGSRQCLREEQIGEAIRSCESSGLKGLISFEGGCKVVKCGEEERVCKPTPEEEKRALFESCRNRGEGVYKDFDENGCVKYTCGQESTCKKDAPSELFRSCGERGGQVVIRRNENGCIAFADCVQRGDERNAAVEDIDEIPQTTEMLSLVFKLEQLRIEFDKLAKDAGNIADYYKSTGSKDEARYRRAADMFKAGKEKIDEIRTDIKDALDDLTKDDVLEFRRDIRYIKDVMLKDILYVMLAEGEDLDDIESGETNDCGTDGGCFDDAIRLCRPVKFSPEGRKGPRMEIVGLENGKCVLKGVLPEDQGPPAGFISGVKPPYEMVCRLEKYALGVKGPEDILPFCEGPLAEMAKRFGGAASASGEEFPPPEGGPGGCRTIEACTDYCIENYDNCVAWAKDHPAYGSPPSLGELRRMKESGYREGPGIPGVPGKCSGRECERYCGTSQQAAKECLEHLGQYLPPEAKQGLQMLSEGRGQGFFSSGGEDEFRRPDVGEGYVRSGSGGYESPGYDEFRRPGTDEFRRPGTDEFRRPASGGYQSPTSGGYQPPSSGGYSSPSSGPGYESPSYGGGYVPPSGGSYQPPSSGGYQPPSSTGDYRPPTTDNFKPIGSV